VERLSSPDPQLEDLKTRTLKGSNFVLCPTAYRGSLLMYRLFGDVGSLDYSTFNGMYDKLHTERRKVAVLG